MPPGLCVAAVAKETNDETEGPRERLDLRLSPDIRARIEKQRKRFDQSMSAYIRQAIVERLALDEDQESQSK